MVREMITQEAQDQCVIVHLREDISMQKLSLGYRLEEIQRLAVKLANSNARIARLERENDQFIRLSTTWAEHPRMPDGELFDGPCACQECCSYESTDHDEQGRT